jgi:nitroreductase
MNVTLPPTRTLHRILERACRAPSVHNSQPWRWRVEEGGVTLLADRTRQLMRIDPEGRDLVLSCGAALHHLRVAALAEGYRCRVRRVPYGADHNVLAQVEFVASDMTPAAVAAVDLIERRRTDRRRFSSWAVPEERLDALADAAAEEGVRAVPVTGQVMRRRLVEILARAAREQQFDWSAVDETAAWTGRRSTDGVPPDNVPRRLDAERHADPVGTRYPSGTLVDDADDHAEAGYDESQLLVLCTLGDETVDRLQAGEALSAVLLAATWQGLASVPLSQATEVHLTRRLLQREILLGVAVPQIVVRVGWGPVSYGPVPATPRRPLADVLEP